VWTGESWATATLVKKGVNPRVRLHLSDGRLFDCDDHHNLLVSKGPWPEWQNVTEIGKDTPLVLDWFQDWGRPLGDPEDWYWAGRFIGDGWFSSDTAKIVAWAISFGHDESEDGKRGADWLRCKEIGSNHSKEGFSFHPDARGNFQLRGATKAGRDLWKSLGIESRKAKDKIIPPIVFTLDRERREQFLNGYTDADGRRKKGSWTIVSASRELLEGVVKLAQSLGYSANINSEQHRERHGVDQVWWTCAILKTRREVTITSIEYLQPEQMYTLSVDDDRHAFSSEGLISKNSSSQGVIKLAMGGIWKQLPGSGFRDKVRFLMQIHDSLVGETIDDDDVNLNFLRWMCRIMVTSVKLAVPIKVEVKTGYDWLNTKVLFEMSSKEFDNE
jgi:hypothetical protein